MVESVYSAVRTDSSYKADCVSSLEEQCLEAAQMIFLRHLLGITKLDKEKNQCIRQKTGAQNVVKGKVATTCTEDGHKQTTKTRTAI